MIFIRLQEFDYPAASAIASVILAASLLLLFSINTLQSRFGRRVVGHQWRKLLRNATTRPYQLGKWFLIGVGMLVSAFILVVPMLIFIRAFSKGLMPVLENRRTRTCCMPSG